MARESLKTAGMAAVVLGCAFGVVQPAWSFTLGWNSARCGASVATGVSIVAVNDNGQGPLVSSSPTGALTSSQHELLLACENGAPGYFVLINSTRTNNFIQLMINMRGATPPPSGPADLSALIKPSANGALPKNGSGSAVRLPRRLEYRKM
jgi:hypothetical protein